MAEAYREFLRLGPRRTREALHERLIELWGENDAPSASTLATWSTSFGWTARAIEDDEIINRRVQERLRDRLAREAEERRTRRLALSDIQLSAALRAMVTDNPDRNEKMPRDLLDMPPQVLRAINDTVRLAGDTQRLDGGEATARVGAENMGLEEQAARGPAGQEVIETLMCFVGVEPESNVHEQLEAIAAQPALPRPADEEDSDGADDPDVEFA